MHVIDDLDEPFGAEQKTAPSIQRVAATSLLYQAGSLIYQLYSPKTACYDFSKCDQSVVIGLFTAFIKKRWLTGRMGQWQRCKTGGTKR